GKVCPLAPARSPNPGGGRLTLTLGTEPECKGFDDAQVPHRAFNFQVAEQKLHCTQVARASIDESGFGATHRMRGEFARVEPDPAYPFGDQPRILSRGQSMITSAATGEQAFPWSVAARAQILVQRLPRDLRQLEPDRPTSLPLADIGAVDGVAGGCHVIHPQGDEIAATELAVDRQIEHRQVTGAFLKLQLRAYRPNMAWP